MSEVVGKVLEQAEELFGDRADIVPVGTAGRPRLGARKSAQGMWTTSILKPSGSRAKTA